MKLNHALQEGRHLVQRRSVHAAISCRMKTVRKGAPFMSFAQDCFTPRDVIGLNDYYGLHGVDQETPSRNHVASNRSNFKPRRIL